MTSILIVVGAMTFAADPPPKVVTGPDKVIVRKRTVVDFNDMDIEGKFSRPDGTYEVGRKKTAFESRMKIRDNFDAELKESARDI